LYIIKKNQTAEKDSIFNSKNLERITIYSINMIKINQIEHIIEEKL